MTTKTTCLLFSLCSLLIAACSLQKPSCSSMEAQNAVVKSINAEIEDIFAKRPLLNPRIILDKVKIHLNDIVLESDNTHQLTCSATVTVDLPSDIYTKLSQPQILITFKNFGHMGDAQIAPNAIISTLKYQVKTTEDTKKTIVAIEKEPNVARALWISAMLGVWE